VGKTTVYVRKIPSFGTDLFVSPGGADMRWVHVCAYGAAPVLPAAFNCLDGATLFGSDLHFITAAGTYRCVRFDSHVSDDTLR
jgi:hypothetical protein